MAGVVESLSCVCAGGLNQDICASRMLFKIFGEIVDYKSLVSWPSLCCISTLLTLAVDDHPGIAALAVGGDLLGRVFCVYRHIVLSVPK